MANRSSRTVRLKPDTTDVTVRLKPDATYITHSFVRIATLALLLAAFAASASLLAQPSDRARTEALARRASERLQALQREADRLASDERSVLNDLRRLEVDRQLKAQELQQLATESAAIREELDATAARMEALRQMEAAERPELRARLIEIYKLGTARYLRLLLSTQDLRRIGQASRTVAVLAKLDRDRILSHQKTIADLKSARATLDERQRRLAAVRTGAEKAQAAAARAADARNDLVRDIDRRRDLNAQLAGDLQAVQQKLQLALRDMGNGATVADSGLPLKPFRGVLEWPVPGTVRHRFGRTAGPGGTASNGIEISAVEGTDARAVHDGLVAFADTFAGFGKLVILDHGAQTFSLYGDLLDVAVKQGARVDHGQPVGSVGATASGAPGLYFELRVDGQPVDPLQWLKKR